MKKLFIIFGVSVLLAAAVIAFAISSSDDKPVCPVCNMTVTETADAPFIAGHEHKLYFCSQPCLDKFKGDPSKFMTAEKLAEKGLCLECAKAGSCEGHDCGKHEAVKVAGSAVPDSCASCEGCGEHKKAEAAGAVAPVAQPVFPDSCANCEGCGEKKDK